MGLRAEKCPSDRSIGSSLALPIGLCCRSVRVSLIAKVGNERRRAYRHRAIGRSRRSQALRGPGQRNPNFANCGNVEVTGAGTPASGTPMPSIGVSGSLPSYSQTFLGDFTARKSDSVFVLLACGACPSIGVHSAKRVVFAYLAILCSFRQMALINACSNTMGLFP